MRAPLQVLGQEIEDDLVAALVLSLPRLAQGVEKEWPDFKRKSLPLSAPTESDYISYTTLACHKTTSPAREFTVPFHMSPHVILARVQKLAAARARRPQLLMPGVDVAAEIARLRERLRTLCAPMASLMASHVLAKRGRLAG